jgi:hypothetical protein
LHHDVEKGEVIEDLRCADLDRYAFMDPNHAEEKSRSRNAILIIGVYNRPPKPRRIYLLDAWAEASSHEKWLDAALSNKPGKRGLVLKWRCHYLYIESEVAGQSGWKVAIKDRIKQMGLDASFSVRPLKTDRSANAKHNRIIGMESIYENGFFWVPRSRCDDWIQEYSSYPNGATIDLLDLTGYIAQILQPGSRVASRDFMKQEMQRRQVIFRAVGRAGY